MLELCYRTVLEPYVLELCYRTVFELSYRTVLTVIEP